MTEPEITLHPGPVFYEVFLGALRVLGSDVKRWSEERNYANTNARAAATGLWNGPAARKLRDEMVETIGRETFVMLYRQRMAIEEAKDRAARRGAA